ncbi:MAG: aldehyde dehydrogenase family protein [Christensenella sp.]|uniref:aldehyde dehydrogenase family protein n=1 Tax=Christensenella sp. TaxID=1935934 RepID=UPI002B1F9931|nr:aldehyde dehydrogenase family protein [Christensenella sp.]MEA5002138.1 aldehyde dehydrogenase family protein [Christensenella sp.]
MANVAEIFEKARIAQAEYEKNASQEQVDAAVKAIGKVVYDRAEELAKMAVDESGMGVYEDKVGKCKGKSKCIWNSLKGKKSYGIIDENKETGIIKVAKPKGVVGAVTPVTNPVVTPMCNAMFALKGKNAIVIAPHPRTSNLNKYVVDLFRAELKKLGLPEDLVQTIENPSLDMTQEVMKTADVVVATGGAGMVKSAYSSGKPALGVGPGNVQVIIDRGIDYDEAAQMIIAGRKFDNGIICSGEQSIIAPKDEFDTVIKAFEKNGAYYIEDPADVEKFAQTIFPGGVISKDVVGQSVQKIAGLAGVSVPEGTKVVVLKARGVGRADLLCKEKMCPFMIAIPYDTFEDAMDIAYENLDYEGKGHTCAIHSNDKKHIEMVGEHMPVSRIVVNQPSSTTAGGALTNGFSPTTTLGCGSWGNNSISENLNYTHLINVSQIGLYNKDKKVPTDEEIWA